MDASLLVLIFDRADACLMPTHSKAKVTVHMEIHKSAFAVVSSGCSFEFLKDSFYAVIATMRNFPI